MEKRDLERLLSKLDKLEKPKVLLEQYQTDPCIAADILILAYNDIKGKDVADFGTGNGTFAIGAKLLGAKNVYAIDIDQDAINIAIKNAEKFGVEIEFKRMDVRDFKINVHTVIMNPPFGYQIPFSDSLFIEKAMELSNNIYMLHSKNAREYLIKKVGKKFSIVYEKDYKLNLPYTFRFHRKEIKSIDVKLYVLRVMK